MKPYLTFLLLVERAELLHSLSPDASPALWRLLHVEESHLTPFFTLAADADLTLTQVFMVSVGLKLVLKDHIYTGNLQEKKNAHTVYLLSLMHRSLQVVILPSVLYNSFTYFCNYVFVTLVCNSVVPFIPRLDELAQYLVSQFSVGGLKKGKDQKSLAEDVLDDTK